LTRWQPRYGLCGRRGYKQQDWIGLFVCLFVCLHSLNDDASFMVFFILCVPVWIQWSRIEESPCFSFVVFLLSHCFFFFFVNSCHQSLFPTSLLHTHLTTHTHTYTHTHTHTHTHKHTQTHTHTHTYTQKPTHTHTHTYTQKPTHTHTQTTRRTKKSSRKKQTKNNNTTDHPFQQINKKTDKKKQSFIQIISKQNQQQQQKTVITQGLNTAKCSKRDERKWGLIRFLFIFAAGDFVPMNFVFCFLPF